MQRRIEHIVTESEAGRTVKSLALREMRLSRGQFSSLKFSGGVTVDGKPAHADARLAPGQRLACILWDADAPLPEPYDLPLSIPYRDGDYLIVEKPAPLPTLCSAHQSGPSLENALYAALGQPEGFLFRPVNRLDKGTSGLMVAALNAHAQQLLQRQLHTDDFWREYLAVCEGAPEAKDGVIDLPIAVLGNGPRRAVRPDGKRAVTRYWTVARQNGRSLIRLRLETGRTHQIRVHLAALGCPIVGDYLYGRAEPKLSGRFALHACEVGFTQPLTGEKIRRFSPLPPALWTLFN